MEWARKHNCENCKWTLEVPGTSKILCVRDTSETTDLWFSCKEWERDVEEQAERIIRCMDCRYFIEERCLCEYRKPYVFPVALDGFCAWGEERKK